MRNHYKILIADDSNFLKVSVEGMLKEDVENTYSAFTASNGREACDIAFREQLDLILMDIEMPVMSGIQAIKEIRANDQLTKIPIIVMSSTKQFQDAFIAGGSDFLIKPFSTYELLMRIQLNLNLAEKGKELKRQNELLNAQKLEAIKQRDIIFKQKKDLTDDLHYASHVQNTILPSASDFSNLFDGHFIFNRPKYIVSGDFYWVTQKNEYIVFAVGDCTGHGMSGALMTMAGVNFLNEIVNSGNSFSADQVLNDLREKVIRLLKQKGDIGETSNGMDISLCIYNQYKQTLQFSGANNPLYIVKKGEPLVVIKGDRMPIGFYFEYNQLFTMKEIKVMKGDTVYLFTDGYPDQFGGPFEKKFRYYQFRELIYKAASLSAMESQLELIENTMDKWIEGFEQIDDMLIMGVRF